MKCISHTQEDIKEKEMAHLPIYQSKNPIGKIKRFRLILIIAGIVVALVLVASELGYGFVVSQRGDLEIKFGSGNGVRSSNGLISGFAKQISEPQPASE